jgi:PAS domain S-box-containing protein
MAKEAPTRERMEEALRESEKRLRSIFEAAFEGIAIHENGVILDANPAFEKMFGYPLSELIGMSALDLTAKESRDLVNEKISAKAQQPFEAVGLRKDGTTLAVEIIGKEHTYRGRRVTVAALRDITERKQAEEALRESEERFRRLAENAPDVIFRYRFIPTPGYEYISPAVTAITGYTPQEFYADPDLDLKIIHPDDRQTLQRMIEQPLGDPRALRWIRKDGAIVWWEHHNAPIYDEEGNLVAVDGIARDITERKRMEEALQAARDELQSKVERQLLRRNPYGLTFRELTVLHLVAVGESDKQIGLKLGISHFTAQKHTSNILAKMSAGSRTEAAARALREGMLD